MSNETSMQTNPFNNIGFVLLHRSLASASGPKLGRQLPQHMRRPRSSCDAVWWLCIQIRMGRRVAAHSRLMHTKTARSMHPKGGDCRSFIKQRLWRDQHPRPGRRRTHARWRNRGSNWRLIYPAQNGCVIHSIAKSLAEIALLLHQDLAMAPRWAVQER